MTSNLGGVDYTGVGVYFGVSHVLTGGEVTYMDRWGDVQARYCSKMVVL